jgi:hypothetical protein
MWQKIVGNENLLALFLCLLLVLLLLVTSSSAPEWIYQGF